MSFTIFQNENFGHSPTYCDDDHPEIEFQDSSFIADLYHRPSFNIAAFEVEIVQLTGPLTGKGVITLPFQNKKLLVNFSDLNINQHLQVVSIGSGSISAVTNGSVSMPTGSLSLGGEACIPPEESQWNEDGTNKITGELWDPNGFGQDGQYSKEPPYEGYHEGDPFDPDYDPCGFDVNGIHIETDSLCNPNGCSRDSLTCDTPPQTCALDCVPYYWLQNDEVNQAGIVFYDSILSSLPSRVDSLLSVIQSEYDAKLELKQDSCHSIATDMRDIVISEELDSISIFGENSEYINPGLSTKFESAPQKSLVRNERNENIIHLEDFHVDLYKCDQQSLILEAIVDYLDDFNSHKDELMAFLELKIKSFNSDSVQKYKLQVNWLPKLKKLIEQFIDEENNDGIGLMELSPSNHNIPSFPSSSLKRFNSTNNPYFSEWASHGI
jgi:hypothetical protein